MPLKTKEDKSSYMCALIDKHKRLTTLTGKRVLLVGGSNLAFGIDSKRIQEDLKIPVVNLGLHGDLGLDFMLNEVSHFSRKGDIIILSPEYYLSIPDPELKAYVTEIMPEVESYYVSSPLLLLKLYWVHTISNMRKRAIHTPFLSTLFNIENNELLLEKNHPYMRSSFNEYGDVIGHLYMPTPKHDFGSTIGTYHYYEGIDKINSFYALCITKNIEVFFLYPTLAKSVYLGSKDVLTHYQADFSESLNVPILNTPATFVLPDSLFFDTKYHLTKQGREIRTNKLINILAEQHIN